MTAADRAYAEARDQGLPAQVEDPATLARLAVLLAGHPSADEERAA